MSAPRIIAQIVIVGSQILGKAFVEAWKQAARNASAGGGQGAAQATQGGGRRGAVDAITRTHNMTLDEAANILNVKRAQLSEESEIVKMLGNFDHLFAANNPLTKEGKPHSSLYLQSKIVRAKERIEAEMGAKMEAINRSNSAAEAAGAGPAAEAAKGAAGPPPPPPTGP